MFGAPSVRTLNENEGLLTWTWTMTNQMVPLNPHLFGTKPWASWTTWASHMIAVSHVCCCFILLNYIRIISPQVPWISHDIYERHHASLHLGGDPHGHECANARIAWNHFTFEVSCALFKREIRFLCLKCFWLKISIIFNISYLPVTISTHSRKDDC